MSGSEGGGTDPGRALAVEDLAVPFGAGPGLEGVGFAVGRGERLVLVGASGAGKTTLLRAIAGLARPDAGRVWVAGRDVTAEPPERRDIVYLHQTPVLFPHLNVYENVAFPLRVRRVAARRLEARVRSALELVRLPDLGERRPGTLSGGQWHRVALARAVVARPAVLLLDEPLASLDPSLRGEVREAIVALAAEHGPALVMVTHDLDEAGGLADRMGLLLDRRLAHLAEPRALLMRPPSLAAARFLGMPNLLPCIVRGDTLDSPLGRLPVPEDGPPPGAAVLGFWPAALEPVEDGVEGRVTGLAHGPGSVRVRVRVGEHDLVMEGGGHPPAPGDAVRIRPDPARIVVYPG